MKNNELTSKEAKYIKELVPRLAKYKPRQWVQISDIANSTSDFINTLQQLCDKRFFDDDQGYCIIEIKEDSFVRLEPNYLRNITPCFKIWKQ